MLILTWLANECNGQPVGIRTPTHKELFREGKAQFNAGHWFMAEGYFKRLFRSDTNNASLAIKIGICRKGQGFYHDAEKWLLRGLAKDPSGPMLSEAFYHLALVNEWKGTSKAFTKAVTQEKDLEKKIFKYLYEEQKQQWSRIKNSIIETPDSVSMKLSCALLNTEAAEFSGQLTEQGLFIASNKQEALGGEGDPKTGLPFPDIYRYRVSSFDKVNYDGAGLKDHKTLNTIAAESPGVFGSKGRRFYFTRCENEMPCKIYVTVNTGTEWTEPQPLNENVNAYGFSTKHPALNETGDTLLFTTDRKGGKGGYDIWFSVSEAGDKWGKARPLSYWNTPLDDVSPSWALSRKVWLWASNGRKGIGCFDIYSSTGFDKEPVLLPYPINTTSNDYFPSERGNLLAWTSDRPSGKGLDDIWIGELPGSLNQFNNWPKYQKPKAQGVAAKAPERPKPMPDTLPPGVYPSEFVFFDFDSFEPQAHGFLALDTLAWVMKAYPQIRIFLYGYTDPKGSDSYNKNLAAQRVNRCFDYLKTKGVEPERMKIIAFGKKSEVDTSALSQAFARAVEIYFERRIPKMKGLFMSIMSFKPNTSEQAKAIGFSEKDFCRWNVITPGPIVIPRPIRFPRIIFE